MMARKTTAEAPAKGSATTETTQEHVTGRGWHGDPKGHAAAGRKGGRKVSQASFISNLNRASLQNTNTITMLQHVLVS